ncbi:hypothetical protein H5410_001803 [Solanum commersonii]|uniref:Uncharacterized protein n=1 Tax=Solanum commersonii TaxID=4109 RepID=A0A9J6B024_SOLCO|nr:hypothetical protein H5410_001803 [Solanum commersonii]
MLGSSLVQVPSKSQGSNLRLGVGVGCSVRVSSQVSRSGSGHILGQSWGSNLELSVGSNRVSRSDSFQQLDLKLGWVLGLGSVLGRNQVRVSRLYNNWNVKSLDGLGLEILNQSNTCPLCRYKLPKEDEDEIEKDLQVILDGEIGGREFQDNKVVLESTKSSLSDDGEDDDDLRDMDLDEMRDEDGDIMMIDAINLKEKHIDISIARENFYGP